MQTLGVGLVIKPRAHSDALHRVVVFAVMAMLAAYALPVRRTEVVGSEGAGAPMFADEARVRLLGLTSIGRPGDFILLREDGSPFESEPLKGALERVLAAQAPA